MIAPLLIWAAATSLPSSPDLGKAEGQCRADEHGPSFLVTVNGIKDRKGRLKLELYPANDDDFLADDNILVAAGKAFRRVEIPVPASGPIQLCIRAPGPGIYALSLLHDRDGNRKFALSVDGIGFAGNPKLGMRKPSANAASARALTGPTPIAITLNYRRSLFSFGPLER
ncbi:DUF2141 domain-containing protein [Sphingobium olei]|uniref:DUF2141 domain-containing protein n=1 Tax=Sphingobium olei TaxID=420955 RepID=A0ABW3NXY4_9SPHN